jgi:hypothetical protein
MRPPRHVRRLAAAQGAIGAVLLARPQRVTELLSNRQHPAPEAILRLLGARMLAQAGVQCVLPTRRTLLAGAAVDASHAASMLLLALHAPRYRRPALASAGLAAAFAASATRTARSLS